MRDNQTDGRRGDRLDLGDRRLLAAIDAHKYNNEDDAIHALLSLPGAYAAEVGYKRRKSLGVGVDPKPGQWSASVIHEDYRAEIHLERRTTLHEAVQAVINSYTDNPLGNDAFHEIVKGGGQ